jgi:hypothetical protein
MYPLTLDYSAQVTYRSAAGIDPLANDSWTTAVFRFSDNQMDVVGYEITATGVARNGGQRIARIISISNAPNPFDASTTISVYLPEAGWVTIGIYDVKGSHVATVVDAYLEAGYQKLFWKADGAGKGRIRSGVYFARVSACGLVQTRKLVLTR